MKKIKNRIARAVVVGVLTCLGWVAYVLLILLGLLGQSLYTVIEKLVNLFERQSEDKTDLSEV